MRIRLCAMLLPALLLPAIAAGDDAWQWGGSLRSLNLVSAEAPEELAPDSRLSSTRLRLEGFWPASPGWRVEAATDYQLLGTDPAGIIPLPGEGVNRRVDLDRTWHHDDGWDSRLQIDRLNLSGTTGRLDAVIGRQAIGFGRIVISSPLDIIAPFPPYALDTDVRPGVDALRLNVHYGLDGQLGAVAVFGDRARHNSYLATWADNHAGVDLLAIGGLLRERPMVGAGVAGSIGTLGLKGEAAVYDGERVGTPGGDLHRRMAMAAVEGWYRFAGGVTLVVQYLYNGAGVDDPADYPQAALSAPLQEGLSALLGRNYLLAAPGYELHPLVTLNGLLIWNLDDGSRLLRPSFAINLADNLSLELFWTHPAGRHPRSRPFPQPPEPRSEFGNQGESGGFFLKWYF